MSDNPRIRYSMELLKRISEYENSKKIPKRFDMWSTLLNIPCRCNNKAVDEKNPPSTQVDSSVTSEANIYQSISPSQSQKRQESFSKPRNKRVEKLIQQGSSVVRTTSSTCSSDKQSNEIRNPRSSIGNDFSKPDNDMDSSNNPGIPHDSVNGSQFEAPQLFKGRKSQSWTRLNNCILYRQTPLPSSSPTSSYDSSARPSSSSGNIGRTFSDVSRDHRRHDRGDGLPLPDAVHQNENSFGHSEPEEAAHSNQFTVPKPPRWNASWRPGRPSRTPSYPRGPNVSRDTSGSNSHLSSNALRRRNEIPPGFKKQ